MLSQLTQIFFSIEDNFHAFFGTFICAEACREALLKVNLETQCVNKET